MTSNSPPQSEASSAIEQKVPGGEWKPTRAVYILILTLCVIVLATALDATSISVALPIMAEKLHGSAVEAFWAGTSFLLTSTVFQPTFASFSSIFGRKPLLLLAVVLFTIGSIIAAVANGFGLILVGRSVQGVGGGGILALAEIIITDVVPLRERGKWMGFLSMMWAIGSVTGPLMGGGFAQDVSWQWIFWINLPFCAIGLVLVPIYLRLNQRVESMTDKLKRIDYVGTVVFVASVTAVLVPLSWGGVMYDWAHWRTLVPLLVGVAGLFVFVLWEIYGATEPMIRLVVFQNRTAVSSFAGTVFHGIILWSILYYLPLYFEAVKGYTPIMAGVAIMPQTFTVAPASVAVGIIVSKTGRFRWALWGGWTLTVLGLGLMYLLDVHTPTVSWIFIDLVAGLGTGALFPSLGFAIQASASNEDTAIAVAMFSFFRALGQTFGIAIGGVIFQNSLKSQISKYPALVNLAGGYVKDAVALVQVINRMPDGELKTQLAQSYADALKNVWLAMCVFAAAGLLTSLWCQGLSLDRELVTEQGLREKNGTKGSKRVVDAELEKV